MSPLLEETLTWVRSQIRPADARDVQTEEMKLDAALVARMTQGDDGEAFLMLLAKMSVLRPSLDPRLAGAASHDYAQRRTGENQLFGALIHYRDLAEHLERTDHDRPRQSFDFGWGGDAASDAGTAADPRFGGDAGWDPGGTVAGG